MNLGDAEGVVNKLWVLGVAIVEGFMWLLSFTGPYRFIHSQFTAGNDL
jgi:hypothetical protein